MKAGRVAVGFVGAVLLLSASSEGKSERMAFRAKQEKTETSAPARGTAESPAAAETGEQAFRDAVGRYRDGAEKPPFPEEARKYRVQAEAAFKRKDLAKAAAHYRDALSVVPWWAEGHYNRALVLGDLGRYREAMTEMKRYLYLAPDAPDARAAQDKVYEWEGLEGEAGGSVGGDAPEEGDGAATKPAAGRKPALVR